MQLTPEQIERYDRDGILVFPDLMKAAILHCNTVHASGHDLSHRDRWQVYMCYNRCANRPHDVPEPRPAYVRGTDWTPLELEAEEAIVRAAEVAA